MDIDSLRSKLQEFGQEHLLQHWNDLNNEEKENLYKEILDINLTEVTEYFKRTAGTLNSFGTKLDDRMEPLPRNRCGSILNTTQDEKTEYEDLAFEAIVERKLCILLLAGGQGTRLGVAYPKGMYDVGLPSGKTLFQLQAERILKLELLAEDRCGKDAAKGSIPWYIMTSASTVKPTKDFFVKHNYFGLNPDNVVIFQQGTLPCFTFDGKIIMSSKSTIARAPDGNGGLYRSLRISGILEDMKCRGVSYIQLFCVDNILVRVGDPVFTGYCIKKGAECGNKVVPKGFPTESVGITCKVDGKYQVVEYSEITSKSAELRNADGSLTYGAANICVHFFTLEFLIQIANVHEAELHHHIAKKKIPYVDESGILIRPDKPNGIKMEKFVFDVFQFANEFVVWECVRQDEFEPLKNADGASDFTPTHCRNALYALHQKYVLEAGGELVDKTGASAPRMISPAAPKMNNNDSDKSEVVICEISPLVTYAGEGLRSYVCDRKIQVPSTQIGLH